MGAINQIDETTSAGGNTGIALQNASPGVPRYPIFAPKGATIGDEDFLVSADLLAFLKAAFKADNRSERWLRIGPCEDYEDANTEAGTETIGRYTRRLDDGKIGFIFIIPHGGKTHHTSLRNALHEKQDEFDFMFVDDDKQLCGTRVTNSATGKDEHGGMGIDQISVHPYTLPNASRGGASRVEVRLSDSSQWNDRPSILPLGFDFGTAVKGLVDVDLQNVTPSSASSGVYRIAPIAGSQNLVSVYATELGVTGASSLWAATRRDTGAAVTISAITAVAGIGFDLTSTVTGIPAGTPIDITWVAPSDLQAGGVGGANTIGYEANTVTVLAP